MRERVSEARLAGAGGPLTATLIEPAGRQRAGLLLSFGISRASALTEHPHSLTARAFLDTGRNVAGFELPCHGERIGAHGAGITGLAAALLAGDDPFARFVEDGSRMIDVCLERGWNRDGPIVVCGVSRAGYCALRLAAEAGIETQRRKDAKELFLSALPVHNPQLRSFSRDCSNTRLCTHNEEVRLILSVFASLRLISAGSPKWITSSRS